MEISVMFPGPTDVQSTITSFHITFLGVGSVEFWFAKGARWTDYKTLHLEVGAPKEASWSQRGDTWGIPCRPTAIYKHETIVIYHLEVIQVIDGKRVNYLLPYFLLTARSRE